MRTDSFRYLDVEFIPLTLEPRILYVTDTYRTSAHLCACGCGTKVFLPLSPVEWTVRHDPEGVTVRPSVGNWEFPCRSHYFITGGVVQWARSWDQDRVEYARRSDEQDLDAYFRGRKRRGLWRRFKAWFLGR
ncbi:hypothetical protein BOH66_01070 [Microbacterium aurum]|uniref:Uncharacterized protein n=1 Tax=Microbacterium aurum TaxID=36805 RepID=A0A1P8U4L1_9MICO|nr:DUF6527 family protein [Microbacterium aurum]APZ33042.1 hypothetical protein BOH66_01070 [Microbacterium aurum]MBM7826598.1 hypothetical protein [Microbacterium aurum]